MTADQFIRICVNLGHPTDDIIREVRKRPFNLNGHVAKKKVLSAVRTSQEVAIADAFDEVLGNRK